METKKYRNGQDVSQSLLLNIPAVTENHRDCDVTKNVQNKQVKYKAYYYKALYLVQYTTFVCNRKKTFYPLFSEFTLPRRLCRSRPVGKNSSSAYRCMTYDVYIVKTRTNKHKHIEVLLYVYDGYGLDKVIQ